MCYFPPRHRPPVDTRNVIPSCPLLPPKVYVIIVYDRDIVIRTASVLTLQNHTPGVQSGGSQRSGDASLSHGHRLSKYSRLHHTIYDRRTTEWETTRMLHVSLTCISTMTVGGAEELDRIRQRLLRGNYASGYVPSAFGQGCDTAGRTHAQWPCASSGLPALRARRLPPRIMPSLSPIRPPMRQVYPLPLHVVVRNPIIPSFRLGPIDCRHHQ